jgi:predicted nucleic acid-binding protein
VILLDTSVLSAVLRRRKPGPAELRLAGRVAELLESESPVSVPGIVLQEILTGISEQAQFQTVRRAVLRGFPIVTANAGDHVLAAELANGCRGHGVAVSAVDALIAALTIQARGSLLTMDEDFERIAAHSSLKVLTEPRSLQRRSHSAPE